MYSYGPPHMAVQKQDDQHEHTFSSYVRIWDVVLKTCLGRWMIGKSGEKGSGISVLPARHDDDEYSSRISEYTKWLTWLISVYNDINNGKMQRMMSINIEILIKSYRQEKWKNLNAKYNSFWLFLRTRSCWKS